MDREVGCGAFEEPRGGFCASFAEDLQVRQPAVIVDRVMDVRVTAALFLVVAVADRVTDLATPTAVGDTAEILDVDVDQIPPELSARSGAVAGAAPRVRCSDRGGAAAASRIGVGLPRRCCAPCAGGSRCGVVPSDGGKRRLMIRRSVRVGVLPGLRRSAREVGHRHRCGIGRPTSWRWSVTSGIVRRRGGSIIRHRRSKSRVSIASSG